MQRSHRHVLVLAGALALASACGDSESDNRIDATPPVDASTGTIDASSPDAAAIDATAGADATATDATAADATTTDAMPADATPADAMPADAMPADAMTADAAPSDAPAPTTPTVTSVDYDFVPRGSTFTITGTSLVNVTSVTIGGVAATFTEVSYDTLIVDAVDVTTPLGTQDLIVTTSIGSSSAFSVEVIEIVWGPEALAHGATIDVMTTGFTSFDVGSTAVTIGGTSQSVTVTSVASITINGVDDATPVGLQPLAIATNGLTIAPILVPAVALVINELDCDTPSTDDHEFIEVGTGVAGVSLDGYVVVLYNGNNDASYDAFDLSVTTDSNGLVLLGNTAVTPAPDIVFADNHVQNGPEAVALYQGTAASFPNGTVILFTGLIDVLVYDTSDADDTGLLNGFYGNGNPKALQINEDESDSTVDAVARCAVGRLDGTVFDVLTPTPGAINTNCP